jgi:hypothetical protein
MSGDRGRLPTLVEIARPITAPMLRSSLAVPSIVANAGDPAARRFLEFFAASIENDNTRMAYYRAVCSLFAWLEFARPCSINSKPAIIRRMLNMRGSQVSRRVAKSVTDFLPKRPTLSRRRMGRRRGSNRQIGWSPADFGTAHPHLADVQRDRAGRHLPAEALAGSGSPACAGWRRRISSKMATGRIPGTVSFGGARLNSRN